MLAGMSARQLAEWMAFYAVEAKDEAAAVKAAERKDAGGGMGMGGGGGSFARHPARRVGMR